MPRWSRSCSSTRSQGPDRRSRIRAARRRRAGGMRAKGLAPPLVIDACDPVYLADCAAAGSEPNAAAPSSSTTRSSPAATLRSSRSRHRTNGTPSASTTRRARPATRRVSSSITAAPISMPSATSSLGPAASSGLPVDVADVPLQRLVLPVDDGGGGRHPRLPAARGAAQVIFDADPRAQGEPLLRRADRPLDADQRARRTQARHRPRVRCMVAGASPPAAMIGGMERTRLST